MSSTVGSAHQHRLEAPLQGRVLFDVLAVLVQGGGPHAAQDAAGQGRLEHIGGVHGAFAGTGAHQGVQFVDKKDHLAFGLFHLLEGRP